jgi:hypothetical protein
MASFKTIPFEKLINAGIGRGGYASVGLRSAMKYSKNSMVR